MSCTKCRAIYREVRTRCSCDRTQEPHLREALLLQVRNDTLPKQRRISDDVKHLLMVVLEQSQLETILCGIEGDGFGARSAIKTVYSLALDAGKVDGIVESANNAIVTKTSFTSVQDCRWYKENEACATDP